MLALTDTQTSLCHKYVDELYAWNQRINLTSVPPGDAWARHVEESLALASELPAGTQSIVDIGSGGGVPGVVLAIAVPEAPITLVEADRRKAGFLMHVAGLLELANLYVFGGRAEAAAVQPDYQERFDVAVSRAAGPVRRVVEWSKPLVRPGGLIFVMSDEEVEGMERRGALLVGRKV